MMNAFTRGCKILEQARKSCAILTGRDGFDQVGGLVG
jgi:hypothetical protein